MIKRIDNIKIPAGQGDAELLELVKRRSGAKLGYYKI